MDWIATFLMLGGMALLPIGIIWLIIALIRHKKKKGPLLTAAIAIVLFAVGIVIMPAGSAETTAPVEDAAGYSDTEIFASEFCMAYMNSLKNPYSFNVKYIWANDVGDGKYEVYVKFTAENSLGGEVADEIATMSSLDSKGLKELARGGEYVLIHTWNSEPTGKILGEGKDLDASKIQEYINANYK